MATIIRFSISNVIAEKLEKFDLVKIQNAVQSELNSGTVTKYSSKRNNEFKTVKDEDGNERTVIMMRSKAGETMRAENTIGNRFYAWCTAMDSVQQFGETPVSIPQVYLTWMEKFAIKA